VQRVVVVFLARHGEQLVGILQAIADAIKRQDDVFKRLLFLAEFLRALSVIPDLRVFKLARNGIQLIEFLIVVKDTSEAQPFSARDR
jgi:hypothetical protein